MEYAKDEVFSIKYNSKKDKLEYKRTNKVLDIIRKNRFITLLIIFGGLFSTIKFILIYYFFTILNRI